MSQYPPPQPYPVPYQTPSPMAYGYPPPGDGRGPARRAAWLMFALGGVVVLAGGCFALAGPFVLANGGPQADQLRQQLSGGSGVSAESLMRAGGGVLLVIGLGLVTIAAFVRRGGRGAVVTGIVATSLVLLYGGLNLLVSALHLPDPNGLGGVCVSGLLLGVAGLQLAWLIAALRAAGTAADAGRQYAAYYAQYQQASQAYGYGQGYGYGGGYAPVPSPAAGPYAGQATPPVNPPARQPPAAGGSDDPAGDGGS